MSDFLPRPIPFIHLSSQRLREELDKWLPRIFGAHGALNSTAIQAAQSGTGFQVVHGSTSVLGSKVGFASGLAQVTNVQASIDNGAVATNFTVSARPSISVLGGIDIYVYQPTAVANTTPIAATTAVTVRWWAQGTTVDPQGSDA